MTQDAYQKVCIAALSVMGWVTRPTDRAGRTNEAGWQAYYDEDFKARGTFCIPVAFLRNPTLRLLLVGDSTGFFCIAKPHLRRELTEKRASLSDSKEFLVVPVAIAMELSIMAVPVEVTDDAEG